MKAKYRIQPIGGQFKVIDLDNQVVDFLPTKEAAEEEIERCLVEDSEWKTAKILFDLAIKAHMEMFGLDRETSRRVMRDATEVAD